jgi:transcriptional regulator with XRE-family HTH domain
MENKPRTRQTHSEVGAVLGMSPSAVSRLRRGLSGTSPLVLKRMSVLYEIPMAALLDAYYDMRQGRAEAWVDLLAGTAMGPTPPIDRR